VATPPIYHLAIAADWDAAAEAYVGSTLGRSLAEVGFVHCSTAAQVQRVADLFYRGRGDVVLLEIDPERLGVPLRYEEVPGGERFPHVYGPLSRQAVLSATPVPLGEDGRLELASTHRLTQVSDFDALVAEAEAVPLAGFDFSWFEGRATEQRPSWGYVGLVSERIGTVGSVLDIETGGGEVFAEGLERATACPSVVAATEAWAPNVPVAERRLAEFGGRVVHTPDGAPLPFADGSFELVVSRHPVSPDWPEITRVLVAGGTYLSQQVGQHSNRELYEALMGPQPDDDSRSAGLARQEAEAAGLSVARLEDESLEVVFLDVGAVVHFLRKVPWTVPDFTVPRYRTELRRVHDEIEASGRFVSHSRRMLVEARKPRPG
jgi:uncharacterized protein (DUF952 family)